jgi:hypothetical protein
MAAGFDDLARYRKPQTQVLVNDQQSSTCGLPPVRQTPAFTPFRPSTRQKQCGIDRGRRAHRGSTTAYPTPISISDPLKNFHSRTIANVSRRQ